MQYLFTNLGVSSAFEYIPFSLDVDEKKYRDTERIAFPYIWQAGINDVIYYSRDFDLAKVVGFVVIGCGLAGFFLSKDEGIVMAMLGFGSGLLGITKAKGD